MNRLVNLYPGPTMTPDLCAFQAITQECISPTIIIDNDVMVDTVLYPNSASRIGQAGVRTMQTIMGVNASNSIFHSLGILEKNNYPFIDVRLATAYPVGRAYNQRRFIVQVTCWSALEDGAEIVLRLTEIIKLLLDNNFFTSENSGFIFGRYYNETGARQYQDTGWYQSVSFEYTVSVSPV